jgi:hypothetical protein
MPTFLVGFLFAEGSRRAALNFFLAIDFFSGFFP